MQYFIVYVKREYCNIPVITPLPFIGPSMKRQKIKHLSASDYSSSFCEFDCG